MSTETDYRYNEDETIDPIALVDRVNLSLHHHISPAEDEPAPEADIPHKG